MCLAARNEGARVREKEADIHYENDMDACHGGILLPGFGHGASLHHRYCHSNSNHII